MSLRAWVRASRPLAHANIAPPLILGQALAFARGAGFDWAMFAVALAFGALDHLAIVFGNDYADREADRQNPAPTFLSGGSRVIPDGLLPPGALKWASLACAALLLAGSALVGSLAGRPWLPALAAAALLLLHAYSFAPLRLSHRGFGEMTQAVGVGLVLPLVGYYLQSGSLEALPLPAFGPLVLLGFASNIFTALPDTEADRAAGKRTWPVRRGEGRARRDALVLTGLALFVVTQVGPPLPGAWTALTIAPAALLSAVALRYVRRADSTDPRACLRFVVSGAGAGTLLQVSWTLALFLAPT